MVKMVTVRQHLRHKKHGDFTTVRSHGRKLPLTQRELRQIKVKYEDSGAYVVDAGNWVKEGVLTGGISRPAHVDKGTWDRFKDWLKRNKETVAGAAFLGGVLEFFVPGGILAFGSAAGLFGLLPFGIATKLGWTKSDKEKALQAKQKLEKEVLKDKTADVRLPNPHDFKVTYV